MCSKFTGEHLFQKCDFNKVALQLYMSKDRRSFYCIFTTHMTSICDLIKKLRQKYGLFMQKNTFIDFHHFMKKNRKRWRLNHSSKTFLNQWESMAFCKLVNLLQKFEHLFARTPLEGCLCLEYPEYLLLFLHDNVMKKDNNFQIAKFSLRVFSLAFA